MEERLALRENSLLCHHAFAGSFPVLIYSFTLARVHFWLAVLSPQAYCVWNTAHHRPWSYFMSFSFWVTDFIRYKTWVTPDCFPDFTPTFHQSPTYVDSFKKCFKFVKYFKHRERAENKLFHHCSVSAICTILSHGLQVSRNKTLLTHLKSPIFFVQSYSPMSHKSPLSKVYVYKARFHTYAIIHKMYTW